MDDIEQDPVNAPIIFLPLNPPSSAITFYPAFYSPAATATLQFLVENNGPVLLSVSRDTTRIVLSFPNDMLPPKYYTWERPQPLFQKPFSPLASTSSLSPSTIVGATDISRDTTGVSRNTIASSRPTKSITRKGAVQAMEGRPKRTARSRISREEGIICDVPGCGMEIKRAQDALRHAASHRRMVTICAVCWNIYNGDRDDAVKRHSDTDHPNDQRPSLMGKLCEDDEHVLFEQLTRAWELRVNVGKKKIMRWTSETVPQLCSAPNRCKELKDFLADVSTWRWKRTSI